MKKLCCLSVFAFFGSYLSAQNNATLDSAMKLLRVDKKTEALPLFKRTYDGTDESLKQKATVVVSEYWAAHKDSIKKEEASAHFGNMLSGYVRWLLQKQSPSLSEIYAAGIGCWGVYSTGALKDELRAPFMETALGALNTAAKQGYPNASYYMVQVLRRYKLFNAAVPYQEIFAWSDKAMADKKSVLPVLELIKDMGDVWYKKELADTSRQVLNYAFSTVLEKMPDSLYLVVDRIWKNSQESFVGEQPVSYLNGVFAQLTSNSGMLPRVGKAFAWHLLYKYMYEGDRNNDQKYRDNARAKIMDTIRKAYGTDEKSLMMLTADFIASTKADDMYDYANLQEIDWMNKAATPFTGNAAFYRAAVLSGRFYTHLLEADPNAKQYVQTIVDAYTDRLKWINQFNKDYFNMAGGYSKIEFEKLFLYAARLDKMNMEKLVTLPAFANNQALHFHDVNAGLNYLETFMLVNNLALTQEVDGIMAKLNTITAAQKPAFDLTYVKQLVADLSVFRAMAKATTGGVEIENINPFTLKKEKMKIYVGDEGGKKKDELLAQLKAFLAR